MSDTIGLTVEIEKNRVIEKLKEKKVFSKCNRCETDELLLLNHIYNMNLIDKTVDENGNSKETNLFLPCFVIVCQNCGYIMNHSIGMLGLINEDNLSQEQVLGAQNEYECGKVVQKNENGENHHTNIVTHVHVEDENNLKEAS